jgi:hypothetical protein
MEAKRTLLERTAMSGMTQSGHETEAARVILCNSASLLYRASGRCALLAQIAAVLSPVRFGGKADIG